MSPLPAAARPHTRKASPEYCAGFRPRVRIAAALLCAVWVLAVASGVLRPTPAYRAAGGSVRLVLASLHGRGLPTYVSSGVVEFAATVLMFVPLGLFWFILTPRGWRWAGPWPDRACRS